MSVWHHFAQCNGVEFNTFAWQVKGCLFNPRWRYKSPLALQKISAAPLPWEVTREQLNVARQQQDFLRTMKIWLGSKTKLAFCIFLDKSARWPLNLCCALTLSLLNCQCFCMTSRSHCLCCQCHLCFRQTSTDPLLCPQQLPVSAVAAVLSPHLPSQIQVDTSK